METSVEKLFTTPLTEWHRQNGAKMVPFAGWEMPVQYASIIAEHNHTRAAASLFDICHMGEFMVSGPGAAEALGKIVTQNLATLGIGKCRYGFLTNEHGGVLDDQIIYCLEKDRYMVVVNASRIETDAAWITSHLPEDIVFENISDNTAKIDLQGPQAFDVLQDILEGDWTALKYFNFIWINFQGVPLMVSRTGYTGELGYEFFLPASKAQALWELCLSDERVKPAGLGARDTIRLEMGYPLYGQDLDENHTPAEAGFGPLLNNEADYPGKGKDKEIREQLIALAIPGRRSARHHDKVFAGGAEVGHVTSGSFSPSLGHAVALAYVKADAAQNDAFIVKTGKAELEAVKTELPFYKNGTARVKLS